MKRLSIKVRLTLWYAALLMLICVLLFIVLAFSAARTEWEYSQHELQKAAAILIDELEYEDGLLEIDNDLDDVPNIYAALFAPDGSLIYGRRRVDAPFEEGVMRRAESGQHSWYILDTLLHYENREDVWLRIHTSTDALWNVYQTAMKHVFWLFPALSLLALVGGYLLTARAFRPIQEMSQLAASIAGGKDLTRRIGLNSGGDELHALSATLDGMLERLEHSFEREQRFTSDVAHELRTPLNALATQCEYALSRENAEEKDEALFKILEKNQEMNALVGQLLLLARMESGQLSRQDDCPLDEMLRQIATDLQPVAEEKGIRIQTSLSPAHMAGNRALLTRAVVNLVDNAIRYGREGGEIVLGVHQDSQSIRLTVKDDGCGIKQEELPRIFDRFWRADSTRSTPGTGIGLSIVRGVVEVHGGEIKVESTLGQGTQFTLILPAK